MVWKKKKIIKHLERKKLIHFFGTKFKKILSRYFSSWKKRFLWSLEDSKKFLRKFKKKNFNFKTFFNFSNLFLKNYFISLKNLFYRNFYKDLFLKKWIFSLIKILIKDGKKKKAFLIVNFFLLKLKEKFKNLKVFFLKIKKKMHLPLKLRLRVVAGRKIFIPVILTEEKEIMLILRFIFISLKFRSEKSLKIKLLNEFLDIFNNKGLSIKKKIQHNKDIKENIPNIRYLNF